MALRVGNGNGADDDDSVAMDSMTSFEALEPVRDIVLT